MAGHGGCIYIDLCNKKREIVEVSAEGWRLVTAKEAPVRFRRTEGMQALPRPQSGGSLSLLRRHIRLASDKTLALLLAWMVQVFRPRGPCPVLTFVGEQGTGKSTASKMVRSLVDPSRVPIRTRPRQERDLVIAADNGWVLAFDNLSGLQPWLSDAFCRLSTGGGFGTRRLYANREEELFYALRPLLLNGIDDLTTRPDLGDRALVLELQPIPDEERKTEKAIWSTFRKDRPLILGALFDAVSAALANEVDLKAEKLPRMADFASWAMRAEAAFPVARGTFWKAYDESRSEVNETAVESDTVASAVRAMLEEKDMWEGKTSELLEELKGYLPNPAKPPRDYPKSYQAMGSHLRRIQPALRAIGIERTDDLGPKGRTFRLEWGRKEAEEVEGAENRPSGAGSDSASPQQSAQRSGEERKEINPSRPLRGNSSASSALSASFQLESNGHGRSRRGGAASKEAEPSSLPEARADSGALALREGALVSDTKAGQDVRVVEARGQAVIVEDRRSGERYAASREDLELIGETSF